MQIKRNKTTLVFGIKNKKYRPRTKLARGSTLSANSSYVHRKAKEKKILREIEINTMTRWRQGEFPRAAKKTCWPIRDKSLVEGRFRRQSLPKMSDLSDRELDWSVRGRIRPPWTMSSTVERKSSLRFTRAFDDRAVVCIIYLLRAERTRGSLERARKSRCCCLPGEQQLSVTGYVVVVIN